MSNGALIFPADRSLPALFPNRSTLSIPLPEGSAAIGAVAFAALFVCARVLGLAVVRARRSSRGAMSAGEFVQLEYAPDISLAQAFATMRFGAAAEPGDLDLAIVEPGGRSLGADAELRIESAAEGARLSLTHRAASISARDFLEKIVLVAQALATRPECRCCELELVTATARGLLPDLSREIVAPPHESVAETFFRQAARLAKLPALVSAHRSYSYAELSRAARFSAQRLLQAGVAPGDIVAISGFMSFGMIAAILATLASGGIVVTIDHALPRERQKLILDISRPRFLIRVAPMRGARAAEAATLVATDWPDAAEIAAMPDETPALPRCTADSAAYVFFTSGSTGAPKGVLGAHLGLSHFLDWQRASFPIGPGDRAAQITALSFDVVLRDVLFPLTSGAELHFPDRGLLLDARRMLGWISDRGITVMHCVPSLMKAWLHGNPDQRPFRSLRYIFFAGEPLTEALLNAFVRAAGETTQIVNLYGPTETTLAKLAHRVERIEPGVQPVGAPQPGVDVAIVRDRRFLCGLWEIGEIAIRTPYRSKGYLNRDDLTGQVFLPNRFRDDPSDLIYYTGDLGRYRSDGKIEIFGRIDSQIKIHGVRIEPNEIESQILSLPHVRDAAVTVRVGANDEKALIAVVARDSPLPADRHAQWGRAIREELRERMSEAMVPARVVVVESLPYLPNGKLDRKSIAAMALGAADVAPRRPRALDARTLALVEGIERVLGFAIDDLDKSFVDLGGDSLSYVRVSMLIEDLLGDLPPDWERQPLSALCRPLPATEVASPPGMLARFETTLLLRAAAIVLVVLSHMGPTLPISATSTLFIVSGMNFSRFLRPATLRDGSIRPTVDLILKFGIPAGLWQAAILWTHPFWAPNLFLLGTLFQDPKASFFDFWYLDVLAANLLILALIAKAEFHFRRARRARGAASGNSFAGDLVFFVLSIGAAAVQVTTGWWDGRVGTDSVGPFKWLWMLALGVLITQADTGKRKAIVFGLLAAVAAMAYAGPSAVSNIFAPTDAFFFGAALLLVWARNLPIPRLLHRPLVVIASSTLFIYITHISVIKRIAPLHVPGSWLWELAASLAVGVVTTFVWNALVGRVTRLWTLSRREKPGTVEVYARPVLPTPAE